MVPVVRFKRDLDPIMFTGVVVRVKLQRSTNNEPSVSITATTTAKTKFITIMTSMDCGLFEYMVSQENSRLNTFQNDPRSYPGAPILVLATSPSKIAASHKPAAKPLIYVKAANA